MPAVLLSIVLSVLACGFVGVRMLFLTRRTGKLPELGIGVGLLGFALAQVSRLVLAGLGARFSPELGLGVYVFMEIDYLLAQFGLCLFTVSAFGIGSRWRWGLLLGLLVLSTVSRGMMVEGSAPQLLSGAPTRVVPLWEPAGVASFALAFGWMALESLRYHRLLRRRLALGLADPVVTNRFFLWGTGAAATCVLVLLLMGLYVQGITLMTRSLAASVLVTVSGVVMAVVPWLTFAPPRAYLRWVQRRAERDGVGTGCPPLGSDS